VLGKLQPQALELEEAVLGAMMMEQTAVNSVIDVLKPESLSIGQSADLHSHR
jgi:replicative DNA helicase